MKSKTFRKIKYSIQNTGASSKGECIIDMDSVIHLAEEVCLNSSKTIEEYVKKLENLSNDIEALGRKVFKEDDNIYFGYYCGITDIGMKTTPKLFGFGIYHKLYKTGQFKYYLSVSVDEVNRDLKINSVLGDDK